MRYFLLSTQFRKDLPQLRREDVKLMAKLWELIDNILDTPFIGLGKPERPNPIVPKPINTPNSLIF